jgi:hypothetical protein
MMATIQKNRNMTRRLTAALVILAAAACGDSTAPATASVQFKVDAPFCGSTKNTYQLSIDNSVVGIESLSDRQTSQIYHTSAGSHVLGSGLVGSPTVSDTTVTLHGGEMFTAIAPLYCS